MSILDLPRAHRPGVRAWALLTWTEAKLVARDTAGLLIPLGMPLLIMVMNGLGADPDAEAHPGLGGFSPLEAIVLPLTLVMVVAVIGMVNMPSFLAGYRRYGILRRLAVTPAHPTMVLAAQVVVSATQTLIGVLLALGLAVTAFGVRLPADPLTAIAVFALTALAMYGVGMLVAAVARTPNASVAIGLIAFFATMALGGGFGGRHNLPDALGTLGAHLPFGAGMDVLAAAWIGQSPDPGQLGALLVTAAVGGLGAARLFRWT